MRILIAGTDTDIGKTHVAAALLAQARLSGHSCLGLKPVAAGADYDQGQAYSEDAARLANGAGYTGPLAAINPTLLIEPIAPHIAADRVGLELSAAAIASWAQDKAQGHDRVLLEGAGGWRVPLNRHESFADIAKHLDWSVVLVVGMRLGCINHALLTAEAIQADNCHLAGWVANRVDPNQSAYQENLTSLVERMPAPLLGQVPYGPRDPEAAAQFVSWPAKVRRS